MQFSKLNRPDPNSGYTLDDNARAMIAMCQDYKLTRDIEDLKYISIYLNFLEFCLQDNGRFLNYVDIKHNLQLKQCGKFRRQFWKSDLVIRIFSFLSSNFAFKFCKKAENVLRKALVPTENFHSPRAMAFVIKGLYYFNRQINEASNENQIKVFADRLMQMYRHEAKEDWKWFESYLTYANSVLPEAMLCAYAVTNSKNTKTSPKNLLIFNCEYFHTKRNQSYF